MIDRANRTAVAELLRHFVAGQITNDQLSDRLPRASDDRAVQEVGAASWYLYSDLWEYKLVGRDRASPATRAAVARWILFLQADLEYEYPYKSWAARLVLTLGNVASLGVIGHIWRWRNREHLERWPFFRESDLQTALRHPKLLAGTA